ncbi:hypothetical protein BRETT_004700 [Brettanomyces bruxellensis]|uniref:Uncharacterized protein n=1 Tax=Dekkera bruxellensis TaxID=5007 RepID=A0A871RAD9_DEKBR|nr:uncharacterized protein BRETT_004700 [Brettanomyces bruxellensis]QOU20052.1 hypothetical protein BRETT_004700 [Brettanomyces bruxellensis]
MKTLAQNFHYTQNYSSGSLARSASRRLKSLSSSPSASGGKTASTPVRKIKKLERALSKFDSIKKYTTTKTNILRLVLLPYLRQRPNFGSSRLQPAPQSFLLVSASCSVLIGWWKSLLAATTGHFQQLVSLDRNCYLECISRIVSRPEWEVCRTLGDTPGSKLQSQAVQLAQTYSELLLQTFGLAVDRLSVKHVSVAVSAFAGKIFAYSFFWVPRICHGLAFLLNTKVKNYTLVHDMCVLGLQPGQQALRHSPGSQTARESFLQALKDVSGLVPKYMGPVMAESPRKTRFRVEAGFLNSVYPPKGKIQGIQDTRGTWCARWASLDSIDVFCSFLRHYMHICSQILRSKPAWGTDSLHTCALPGMLVVTTHVYEIFDWHMRTGVRSHMRVQTMQPMRMQSMKSMQSQSIQSQSMQSLQSSPSPSIHSPHIQPFSASSSFPVTFSSGIAPPASLSLPSPPLKILKVLRDLIVNPKCAAESISSGCFVRMAENVLKILVCQTKVLQTASVDRILQLFVKFARTVKCEFPAEGSAYIASRQTIDWSFWIAVFFKLLASASISCELRGLSIIYQCWDLIPEYQMSSGKNTYQPVKSDLASRLVSEKMWLAFFGHYLPLVRSFYIRLLVWKVLGQDSLGLAERAARSFGDSIARERLTKAVCLLLKKTFRLTKTVSFSPDDPIINKRIIIQQMDPSFCSATKTEPIRALAYDILDDAAYTCAGLAVSSKGVDDGAEIDASESDDPELSGARVSGRKSSDPPSGDSLADTGGKSPGNMASGILSRGHTKKHSHSWVSRLFRRGSLHRMGVRMRSERAKRRGGGETGDALKGSMSRNMLASTFRDDSRNSSRDTFNNASRNSSKDTFYNASRNSSKDVSKDFSKDTSKDISNTSSTPPKVSLLEKLQEEDRNNTSDSYESLLQTPPRIFGSSTSSPSLSSTSSSLSLLSSMASASSPQSSASSLDFLDQFTSSSKYIESIQKLQRKKKQHSMKFVPPELNAASTELPLPQYRFELINNDLKVSASYQSLHELNSSAQTQSGQSFFAGSRVLIQNTKPCLPDLEAFISNFTASSTDDQIDSTTDLDIDVMASPNIPALQTNLRLPQSSSGRSSESESSGSTGSSSESSSLLMMSAVSSLIPDLAHGQKSIFDKTILKSALFFANGIYEYNQCVSELHTFVFHRLKEFNSSIKPAKKTKFALQPAFMPSRLTSTPDDLGGNICGYVSGVPVYDSFISKLKSQIPWMAPEDQD